MPTLAWVASTFSTSFCSLGIVLALGLLLGSCGQGVYYQRRQVGQLRSFLDKRDLAIVTPVTSRLNCCNAVDEALPLKTEITTGAEYCSQHTVV